MYFHASLEWLTDGSRVMYGDDDYYDWLRLANNGVNPFMGLRNDLCGNECGVSACSAKTSFSDVSR